MHGRAARPGSCTVGGPAAARPKSIQAPSHRPRGHPSKEQIGTGDSRSQFRLFTNSEGSMARARWGAGFVASQPYRNSWRIRVTTPRPAALTRAFVAGIALVFVVSSLVLAATATLSIDSVGGQPVAGGKVKAPLAGTVEVAGRASLEDAGAPTEETRPLVADAGDSPFVAIGDP